MIIAGFICVAIYVVIAIAALISDIKLNKNERTIN